MKIAIIGTGWIGCHLALRLHPHYEVTLFEKNDFFSQTSFKNQNRLHLGYHYARSSATRNLCTTTFQRFISDYGSLTSTLPNNIYAIPTHGSVLDYNTYLKIFSEYNHSSISLPYLRNIEGAIKVEERFIDPIKAQHFFLNRLQQLVTYREIIDANELSSSYDLVINCSNNQLSPIGDNYYSEECELLIYKIKKQPPFDALTLVDGPLFSIFPYGTNLISLSDVEYTPAKLTTTDLRRLAESRVQLYFPDFTQYYEYTTSVLSLKAKINNTTANRAPVIEQQNNVITTFTGKIQGIYYIEDYMRSICEF